MAPTITWSVEPAVVLAVLALAALYLKGWRRARRAGEPHPPGAGRLVLFGCGLLTIAVALISPLDGFSYQLMVMHMVQHILLLDVAPILLILGLTKGLLRPMTRRLQTVERRAGLLAHPAFAVLAYAGFMWLWHLPPMYDAALRNANVHALEHICFAFAGGLYWWHVLSPIRSRMRIGGLGPIVYMSSTKLLVGALGIVLAFAPDSLYPFYQHLPRYWGLSAGEDQSLAGLAMALEQSIVMGIALVVLFVQMLGESEREAQRAERFELV
ncbi:MAG: cytochrome c oxidase assembly protein [Actinomycetota bacterium]|nr:cytochrome c oxidase assembly protein [Actinomycetota bacterium]